MSLPIKVVLKRMTFADLQAAAAINERERKATEMDTSIRLARAQKRIEAEAANRRRIVELGRPEYLFARNAERKEAKRQKYYANITWETNHMEERRSIRRQRRLAQGRTEF